MQVQEQFSTNFNRSNKIWYDEISQQGYDEYR